MPTTVADFQRFFTARQNGIYRCRLCGSSDYHVTTTNHGPVVAFSVPPKLSTDAPESHYRLLCGICGCADWFDVGIVDKWVAANPEVKK